MSCARAVPHLLRREGVCVPHDRSTRGACKEASLPSYGPLDAIAGATRSHSDGSRGEGVGAARSLVVLIIRCIRIKESGLHGLHLHRLVITESVRTSLG